MARTRSAHILGYLPDPRGLDDGTNALERSPLPGVINHVTRPARPRIDLRQSRYLVQRADSLWLIAASKLGSGHLYHDLAKLNGITSGEKIYPGEHLIVPNYERCDWTLRYIYEEMIKNAQSGIASSIAAANARSLKAVSEGVEALDDMRHAKWYELFRIYLDQQKFENAPKLSIVASAEAKARWAWQVMAGQPWDHKHQLRSRFETMPTPPRPFGAMGRALHFPIRGDIFSEYYYDIWSNIHYGYVGGRCGFDEQTLQTAAAAENPLTGTNDEGDVISVKIGVDLWQAFGLNLTAEELRSAIVEKRPNYLAARVREIAAGVAAEKPTNVVISNNDCK